MALGSGVASAARPAGKSHGFWESVLPWSAYNGKRRTLAENRSDGRWRETKAGFLIRLVRPFASIQTQPVLLTREGKPALDPQSGESRRFDFAIFNLFSLELAEVKPMSEAGFKKQHEKTLRILRRYKAGGVFIRDTRDGSLRRIREHHIPDGPLVLG